jgi:hypothetical protein
MYTAVEYLHGIIRYVSLVCVNYAHTRLGGTSSLLSLSLITGKSPSGLKNYSISDTPISYNRSIDRRSVIEVGISACVIELYLQMTARSLIAATLSKQPASTRYTKQLMCSQ